MSGLCSPWVDAEEILACCFTDGEVGSTETEIAGAAAEAASEVLFEITGRRFRGADGCETTVRPCSSCGGWGLQVLSGSGVVVQWYAAWNGGWGGWGWGYGYPGGAPWTPICGCCGVSQVKLAGYPVTEIVEVTIDDRVLDPDEYRLDDARLLTRMADADGNARGWPVCQRLDKPLGEAGTFGITYRYGVAPPTAGILAAKSLACELTRGCSGGECRLPVGVTKVTRQGVQIEQGLVAQYLREGKTSIPELDVFVAAYGTEDVVHSRRPGIWSPDMRQYAGRFGPRDGS